MNNLKEAVIKEIKKIYDPEIPVNIYDLGLIYDISVSDKHVDIIMTLTSPNCPVADTLPKDVKENIEKIKDVSSVEVKLTWNPPWNRDMMTEAAKLELNI